MCARTSEVSEGVVGGMQWSSEESEQRDNWLFD